MSLAFLSFPHGPQESQSPNSSCFLSTFFSLVLEQINMHSRSEHAQSADTQALWDRPLPDRAGATVPGDRARRGKAAVCLQADSLSAFTHLET